MKNLGNADLEALLTEFANGAADPSFDSEPGLQQALRAVRSLSASQKKERRRAAADDTQRRPQVGDWVGHYQLLEQLGEGGMGIVYLARHQSLGKLFALKLVGDRRLNHPRSVARFEREMRLLGQVEHPNVVSATDGGRDEGVHYMVMNYVQGIDARRLVRRLGPLNLPAACEIIRQTATGLQELHAQGLVHRDIKPSNLLVGFDCVIRLADFGLARVTNPDWNAAVTFDGETVGTVAYMSPEQFDGTELGHPADLYSLGATFCFLLCGYPPSQCAIRNPLSTSGDGILPKDIPGAVRNLLQQTLAADPEQRIQSASEVADRLAELADRRDLAAMVEQLRQSDTETAARRSVSETSIVSPTLTTKAEAASDTRSGTASFAEKLVERHVRGRRSVLGLIATIGIVGTAVTVFRFSGDRPIDPTVADANEGVLVDDGPVQTVPPSDSVVESEREIARWLVERGGQLLLFPTTHVKHLEDMPSDDFLVLNVALHDAGIGDSDVARIAALSAIKSLHLAQNPLTNESLDHLASCEKLQWLYMNWTEVDDRGIEALLPHGDRLKTLDLSGTNVSTAGIKQLSGFSVLRELLISDTDVSDEALEKLDRFPALLRIDVARTDVTDAGLAHLQTCPALRYLVLDGTAVSDDAVPHLLALDQLQELKIRDTKISEYGYHQLVDGLPNCTIVW